MMKHTNYIIYFTDGTALEQSAIGVNAATILAQAKRIENAQSYDVQRIEVK